MARIRLGNGRVIVASEEFAEAHFPGDWTVDPDLPPPPRGTTITKLAFIQRFTADEWEELDIASQHDKGTGKPAQRLAAKVRRAKTLIEATQRSIDLAHPATRALVPELCALLQALGVVTDAAARATEILDAPVTDEEAA